MVHESSASFFKNHPKVDEFHFTEDGRHFESKAMAQSHGDALKKKGKYGDKVGTVTRDEACAEKATASEGSLAEADVAKAMVGILKSVVGQVDTEVSKVDEAAIAAAEGSTSTTVVTIQAADEGGKTAVELQQEAQEAYDAALETKDESAIAIAKKNLATAKGRVTREAKKSEA